jgi:hypothetical protein
MALCRIRQLGHLWRGHVCACFDIERGLRTTDSFVRSWLGAVLEFASIKMEMEMPMQKVTNSKRSEKDL